MIKRFLQFYKPHMRIFRIDLLCAFIVAVIDLIYPSIAKNILNEYVPNHLLSDFIVWSVVLLILYTAKLGLNYYITYKGHMMGVDMQSDMRREVFDKLQHLPFTFFDETKSGALTSRIVNDLFDISELAHHGPEDLFLSGITLVGSFILLCRINVPLTLIVFAAVPVVVWYAVRLRKDMDETFTRTRVEIAEVNAGIENSITGIRVSRAYTGEEHELEKFDAANNRYVDARRDSYRVMAKFHSGLSYLLDLLYLIVLVAGGIFFFKGYINAGEFAAYLLYISNFLNPIRKLVNFFEQYENGMSGFKRFTQIMDEHEEPVTGNEIELTNVKGDIDFEHVTFRYNAENKPDGTENTGKNILDDLTLHIPAGRTVALVGTSGGGKTTFCHLIPRFYELNDGRICIDGNDIKNLTRYSLRRNIGMVAQDVFLFTGTIRENIAYGRLDATEEEIIEAAKKANLHDYIMSLPDGYDTYIGERGVKLSGGQKQRVSIARVFLKDPAILILDEATSALDNATEMLIQQSLEELSKGRTCIVVAHRLSTVKNADEIIVMTDEGIIERGTHEELIAGNGMYAGLYNHQFRTA